MIFILLKSLLSAAHWAVVIGEAMLNLKKKILRLHYTKIINPNHEKATKTFQRTLAKDKYCK